MKKKSKSDSRVGSDLRISPVTRAAMRRGTMGKYYQDVMAGSNVVRIAPELNGAFPNEVAVNQALRELLKFRETLVKITADKPRRSKTA